MIRTGSITSGALPSRGRAARQESPREADAIFAERGLTMITTMTQAAEDSLQLEQQLRDQGAPEDQIAAIQHAATGS